MFVSSVLITAMFLPLAVSGASAQAKAFRTA